MSYGRGFEGAAYQVTRKLDITEIAKRIRVNLRNAQELGALPAEMTFSVKVDRYSMGQSIDVDLSGMSDAWTYAPKDADDHRFGHQYSDAAKAAKSYVKSMVDSYNRDDSDAMVDYFDVHFYGHVTLRDERHQRFEAQERFVKAAQKRAAAERKAAGLPTKGKDAQRSAARVAHQARAEFEAQS